MHKVLCLIPARGGSKGIPQKNIKLLNGKPLIAWTIEAAMQSKLIDRIIVSTDNSDIADLAIKMGAEVPFMRPAELATDSATTIDVALHAINNLPKYDWLIVLQPTSPLRTIEDINGILNFCWDNCALSAVSICEVSQHPHWMYKRNQFFYLEQLVANQEKINQRQDLPVLYGLNGAMYLAHTEWLIKRQVLVDYDTIGYVMPQSRSPDLDTPLDWRWVEFLLKDNDAK